MYEYIFIAHILYFTLQKVSKEVCIVQFIQFALIIKIKLKLVYPGQSDGSGSCQILQLRLRNHECLDALQLDIIFILHIEASKFEGMT